MDSIGKEIRGLLRTSEISLYRAAKDLGIATESLHRSLMDGANPQWYTIKKVIEYLGYEIKFVKKNRGTKKPNYEK